jgi:hypothetical protein
VDAAEHASRPWPPSPWTAATTAGEVVLGTSAGADQEDRSRRRRRPRKRKASARNSQARGRFAKTCARSGMCSYFTPACPPRLCPLCPGLDRAGDEGLLRAVVISIVSNRPSVPGDEIAVMIPPWLEVEPTSLVRLRQLSSLVYLTWRWCSPSSTAGLCYERRPSQLPARDGQGLRDPLEVYSQSWLNSSSATFRTLLGRPRRLPCSSACLPGYVTFIRALSG